MKLRKFTINDIKVLKKFKYSQKTELEILKLIDDWNKGNSSGRYFEMFSVVGNERVVGEFSVFEYEPKAAGFAVEIFKPYQRKGYATFALSEGIKLAKDKGYTGAVVQVIKSNTAALTLFRNFGFDCVGAFINPHGYEVVTLKKSLA